MNEHTQAASAASPTAQRPLNLREAFTLDLRQRQRLLHARAQLIELYVLAKSDKPIPAGELVEWLEEICASIAPAAQVALGLRTQDTQAAPAAIPAAQCSLSLRDAAILAEHSAHSSDAEHTAKLLLLTLVALSETDIGDIALPVESLHNVLDSLLIDLHANRHQLNVLRATALRHLDAEGAA